MASSRSEDSEGSISEIVYECISIIDGNTCKKDEQCIKCPLCKNLSRSFYCVECVRNGNFLHSKKKCLVRFADKKAIKYKFDAEKAVILQRYEELLAKKKEAENLKLEIYKSKEKIQLLKASIHSCKGEICRDQKMIEELKARNSISQSHQSQFSEKLFKMQQDQGGKNMKLECGIGRLNSSRQVLQNVIQQRMQELITHIFPISKVSSQYYKSTSSEEGQFAELEEARKTTYIQGQWVIAGSAMDDVQYSVVEPLIPSSGDYSAYTKWCADNIQGISRDSLSVADRCLFDKAYGISAALAYTAQLVGILAFIMDAYVPKKCSFSDFCGHESSIPKFLHKVAKLNANIISLCLLRGVDVSKINAHRTIENLLLVLQPETEEPQRNTSYEKIQKLMESIEDSLSKDLETIDESDSDDLESEYVHISEEEDLFPVPDQASAEPVPAQTSLVSSVFSYFKAAAGHR